MISLYRGELHKVSDAPRQWTVPKSQIPLSVFRNALKKRNAALNKLFQSSPQNTDANGTPVANGTGEPTGPASVEVSGELEKRGGSENDDDSQHHGRAENGVCLSDGKPADIKEHMQGAEEEGERRQERKRRREEDYPGEIGRRIVKKEDPARKVGSESETTSKGKSKVSQEGSEPMLVDSMDQLVAMDCDAMASEKTVIGCDETMAEPVRVRVTDSGTTSEQDNKQVNSELGTRDARETKHKDVGNLRRKRELVQLEATGTALSNFEEAKPVQIQVPTTAVENDRGAGPADTRMMDEIGKKRKELEAKLEKLRAEKHRFVLRLKQVLNEEEVKKRGSLASGSPVSLQGAVAGTCDLTGLPTHGEKHGVGGSHSSADLEDGELEYARTPSPPVRATPAIHGSLSSHSTLGPPPMAPPIGRQTSLSQHLSQSATGSGGYYVPGLGIPPSPGAPGVGGGTLSPGVGFMGNLPSPLGSHSYSHNLALQHAAAIHAQKVTSVVHGHGQFSPIPPTGGPVGAGPGVAGGPPGFSGYAISPSVHSHHSHLSQPASSSSLPHLAGQQVGSSSLLTAPRGPPGYHDMRLGGSTWIQR